MTVKILAVLALLFAIAGTGCGIAEWGLNIFILPEIETETPLQTLADGAWLLHYLGFGGALVCLACAILLIPISRRPDPDAASGPQ